VETNLSSAFQGITTIVTALAASSSESTTIARSFSTFASIGTVLWRASVPLLAASYCAAVRLDGGLFSKRANFVTEPPYDILNPC
jgi:hypothetical protein